VSLESQLVAWLQAKIPPQECVSLGLGDDAAVLRGGDGADVVVTTDMLTDGVDFLLDQVDLRAVGHKALGVNLSDLAAMAAVPTAAFVSLVLPRTGSQNFSALELAQELFQGMFPLAEDFGVAIAGGDTNTWDGPLAISITALGATTERGPLVRAGGKPGDKLLVTGSLGGSLLGRHLQVEPRVREALMLHACYDLHAGIDISDGLALDVSRLAAASDCGAVLDLSAIPLTEAAHRMSQQDGRTPWEHALGDGEDFELVLAVAAEIAEKIIQEQPLKIPLTAIGELIAEPGLWQTTAGQPTPLAPTGFIHE